MTQTLLLVILFVAVIASLPWLVRRMQQRQGRLLPALGASARVLSAIAVGPQQRVVTVEVGPDGERTTLILGVTPQSIRCLHTYHPRTDASSAPSPFSRVMAQASNFAADPLHQSDHPEQTAPERAAD